jgi:hypothetical protein
MSAACTTQQRTLLQLIRIASVNSSSSFPVHVLLLPHMLANVATTAATAHMHADNQ